ncbi:LacI family DNA-binding transcriptional regulator [Nibricoccus aquaticus]|nr:LacI family DNA-binding transcriptional regulator [Nibricoccus aquaticus]
MPSWALAGERVVSVRVVLESPEQVTRAAAGGGAGKRVRLIDVAREAGVAAGTVSRVLNLRRDVGAELVRRVMDAVRMTGYVHSGRVRVGAGGRKAEKAGGDVGVLFFGGGEDALGRADALGMLQGIERELALKGHSLVVGRVSREMLVPHFLTRRRVDGLLLINLGFDRHEPRWLKEAYASVRAFPHVWLKARPAVARGDLCGPDVRRAGFLAADYLAERGHRRVGFFCAGAGLGDAGSLRAAFSAGARVNAMESSLLDLVFADAADGPAVDAERLYEFFLEVEEGLRPTALLVPSYDVAAQFSGLLARAGMRVGLLTCMPERVVEPGGRLTMIDLRFDALCGRAVEQLLMRMRNPVEDGDWLNLSVEPVVIERGSVGRVG